MTAAGDSKQALWVNTWEINSAGVKPLDEVETKTALSTLCFSAPRSQTVAVGAGRSFERLTSNGSTQHDDLVREAFTPVSPRSVRCRFTPGVFLTAESLPGSRSHP